MQDQSGLICRLIYFHCKSEESRKTHKITSHMNDLVEGGKISQGMKYFLSD